MSTSHVRLGIIGAGAIADSAGNAVKKHDDASVTGIFDLSAERRDDFAKRYDVAHTFDSADALFASDDVDAVYIAVPNKFHAPLAEQGLKAGKHVIIDKPFAMNLGEAKSVVAAAKESGKVFTVGMNKRFDRGIQKLKSRVDAGEFGEVYHAKAYWMRRSGIPKLGTWFGNKELAGGGALLDIGVHLLDVAMHLTNNFKPIGAFGKVYTKFGHRGLGEGGWGKSDNEGLPFDVDDFATATIQFDTGLSIALDVTWACHQPEGDRHDVQLFGTDAGVRAFGNETYKPGEDSYLVQQGGGGTVKYEHCERFHNFFNAILGREELVTTPEQALAVQAILDAIYASSETGKPQTIAL